jgi:hypothetical protein
MGAFVVVELATVVGVLLVSGCGDNQDEAGARDLLAQVRDGNYREWARAPGYEARRNSDAPHSDAVDIYVNDVVRFALDEERGLVEWPLGSVIVKDGFSGSTLDIVAIMEKRKNGWYWAEYDDDGDPDYSGKPDVCVDCHDSGSDFVRAFRLP